MSVIKDIKDTLGLLKYPARLLEYLLRYKGKTVSLTRTDGTSIEGEVIGQSSQMGTYGLIVRTPSDSKEVIPLNDVKRFIVLNPGVRPMKLGAGPASFSFTIAPLKPWANHGRLEAIVGKQVSSIAIFEKDEPGPRNVRFNLRTQFFSDWTVEIGEVEDLLEEPELSIDYGSADTRDWNVAPIVGFAHTERVDSQDFKDMYNRFSESALCIGNAVKSLGKGIRIQLCFAVLPAKDAVSDITERILSSALPKKKPYSIQAYAELTKGVSIALEKGRLVACGPPESLKDFIITSLGD